ncbi:putative PurR-regulated permease PerM [Nocardioides albertanoniae]|uniref:Putative PurR-regulated permease PerM n=1 Tax=Nocardioides albertanoniae TaxID=1175486 RepID=A0A543A4J3_9ACTN|nr:AI-2E family transporter [Nocardioides albertanoniae]TQL67523.1 putative PurR-regulated permease PerM [Nocardioides albertanoniae]
MNAAPADRPDDGPHEAVSTKSEADDETTQAGSEADADAAADADADADEKREHDRRFGKPGPPFDRNAPYLFGLLLGLGLLTAYAAGNLLITMGSVILQIVVALFLASGINPMVVFLQKRGFRRPWAVLTVILGVLGALALFFVALVPVISDQVAKISANVPDWVAELQRNQRVQQLNDEYQILDKVQEYVASGNFVSTVFGGALGVGLAVLNVLVTAFVVTVLTLYFIASYEKTKHAIYRLAPASRRDRVTKLGDRIFDGIGGYVSGAFVVALCAGLSTLALLFAIGMGEYAVALAFVVMITDVIPMIGATIGAAIVCAITFATTDLKTGIIAVVFYIAYQQFENYVVYPRVMSRAVDIPGVITVIAALIGASLLGVVGALLAIPAAAAVLMLVREVFVRAQDER